MKTLSDHCTSVLAEAAVLLPFNAVTAQYILNCSSSNSALSRYKLAKAFVVQTNLPTYDNQLRTLFTVEERLDFLEQALDILKSNTRSSELQQFLDKEEKVLLETRDILQMQQIALKILKRHLFFKLYFLDQKRLLATQFNTLALWQEADHAALEDFLQTHPQLASCRHELKDLFKDLNTLWLSVVTFEFIKDLACRHLAPEVEVCYLLRFKAENNWLTQAVDAINTSISDFCEDDTLRIHSHGLLFSQKSVEYPVRLIRFCENIFQHAKDIDREALQLVVENVEARTQQRLFDSKQELEDMSELFAPTFDQHMLDYQFYWLPELLLKFHAAPIQDVALVFLQTAANIRRSQKIDAYCRIFMLARMLHQCVIIADKILEAIPTKDSEKHNASFLNLNVSMKFFGEQATQLKSEEKHKILKETLALLVSNCNSILAEELEPSEKKKLISVPDFILFYREMVDSLLKRVQNSPQASASDRSFNSFGK